MGEVPGPMTGFAALGVKLQPAILSTVTLMSPMVVTGSVPSWTQLMNACMNPTTVTPYGLFAWEFAAVLSMIGIVTIELLVVTTFVFCGPLWAKN
jgi:hypothetical protein